MLDKLATAYRFWRASPAPMPAAKAMAKAREDVAAGINRYARSSKAALASYQNQPGERGGRWIENPDGAGLRFVGWSDELAQTRDRHTGWFLYPDGDPGEVARGCVYQMPSRDGRSVYVEAIRTGEHAAEWRDIGEDGAAYVFLNTRHMGEPGGEEYRGPDHYGAFRDAAHGADREAELFAEEERDYQQAYAAGRRAAEYMDKAKEERDGARDLIGEFRTFCRAHPTAFDSGHLHAFRTMMRKGIRAHIRDAGRKAEKAEQLAGAWMNAGDRLADAFKEGRENG